MDAGRAQQRFAEATFSPAPSVPARRETVVADPVPHQDTSFSQTQSLGEVRGGQPGGRGGPGQPALAVQSETAQQNRGKMLTDPREIVNHQLNLSPQTQANFGKLNPEQQKVFLNLMQSQVAPGTKMSTDPPMMAGGFGGLMGAGVPCGPGQKPGEPAPKLSEKEKQQLNEQTQGTMTRTGLISLLNSGKLTTTDQKGQTLLSNLDRLNTQKLAPGADRNQLIGSTVNDLNMPGFALNPGGSAAAGELQARLATDKPAEYARLVGDLASPGGTAKLGNTNLQRSPEALKSDGNSFQSTSAKLVTTSLSETAARQELFQQEVANNPQAQKRLAAMSPEDRKRFQSLYEGSIPAGKAPQQPPLPKDFTTPLTQAQRDAQQAFQDQSNRITTARKDRGNLTSLLESGKLTRTDSQGLSLVSNLETLKLQSFASEGQHKLDGAQIYSEVLNQVAHPGEINQGARGTCTVTTMEHLQASRDPAEYTRVMSGLTSSRGSVVLRNGETLTRDTGLVAPDDSGRTAASRVYQASMMEFANGPNQDYRNDKDGHFNNNGTPILDDRGKLKQGLPMDQLARVSSAVLGGKFETSDGTMRGNKADRITADMQKALAQDRPIEVGMRWSRNPNERDSYHALSVFKMDDKYVYLRNPWGANEGGESNPSTGVVRQALRRDPKELPMFGGGFGFGAPGNADPSLPVGEAGTLRMKKEDFYANLDTYVVQR